MMRAVLKPASRCQPRALLASELSKWSGQPSAPLVAMRAQRREAARETKRARSCAPGAGAGQFLGCL